MPEIKVLAPLDGKVVALETVPDEVFAQKMVGDGVAIEPTGQVVVAPLTGRLVKLFSTGHAFGLVTEEGVELIVHIGVDTVDLNGQGFEKLATEGQLVQAGTPILAFDRQLIESQGKAVISPVVSVGGGAILNRAEGIVQAGRDVLFTLQV